MHWLLQFLRSQWLVTPKAPSQDWTNKTVIVTGANTGLGLEAAKHLARLNASRIIITARRMEAGQQAAEKISAETGRTKNVVEVWHLDLASFDSIKAFAAKCQSLERLDAVVENAGISTTKFKLAEGHESTITVNVLGTLLLGILLLPKLRETAAKHGAKTHLTIISSETHHTTDLPKERAYVAKDPSPGSLLRYISDPKNAKMSARYFESKLYEILFVRELVRNRLPQDYPVIINLVNPGLNHTELTREQPTFSAIFKFLMRARPAHIGGRTLVCGAEADEKSHGQYMSDSLVDEASVFVLSEQGDVFAKKTYDDIMWQLEQISEGVSSNL